MKEQLKILRFEVCNVDEAGKIINKYIEENNVIDVVSVNFDSRLGYLIVRAVFLIGVVINEK